MKRAGKLLLVLACARMSHSFAAGQETEADNPYVAIADRNAFHLKEPPPATPPDAKPPQPPQKIVLLGIVSWGKLEVIFKIDSPPKPGDAGKPSSFTLGVGERAGEITVEAIDPKTGTVRFNNNGVTDIRTLEKDGLKPGGTPPVPGAPATPSIIPAPMPVPVPANRPPATGALPPPAAGSGGVTTTFGGQAAAGQFGGAASVQRPLRVTPPTTAAGYAGATGVPNPAAQGNPAAPSLEEHTIILEVARKLTQEKVDAGLMPPLPPTPITGK